MSDVIDSTPFEWRECFNHHPAYPGMWVSYNQWRFKEWYDVKLHDGTLHRNMYPNGTAWSGDDGTRVTDEQVAEIRLIPSNGHPIKWLRHKDQSDTIEHCESLFGAETFPDVIPAGDGIAFIPRRYRWFKEPVMDVNGEMVSDLWEGELTMAEHRALQANDHGNTDTTQPSS